MKEFLQHLVAWPITAILFFYIWNYSIAPWLDCTVTWKQAFSLALFGQLVVAVLIFGIKGFK